MSFPEKVYALCAQIPVGKVSTYKNIAQALGLGGGYQAVGQALRCNPYAPRVPCHRVVKSNGSVGGFKGKITGKELEEKVRLLENEGVAIINGKVDLEKHEWKF